MGLFGAIQSAFGGNRIDLDSRFDINAKRWKLGNNGSFNLVSEKKSETKFLIKLIDPTKTKKYRGKFPGKGYPSEVELSSGFNHEGIFAPVESGQTKNGEEFLLYKTEGWTRLEDVIAQRDHQVRKNAYALIRQLAQSLIKIHGEGYIHRDVCPRNIYVDQDRKNLKLLDFGLTIPNQPEYLRVKNRIGTPLYMAPEIVRMREITPAVDIFSFGITIYQLLSFEHPWGVEDNSSKSTLQFEMHPAEDIRTHLPKFKEPKALAIAKLLEVNVAQRFSNLKQFLMKAGIR